MQQVSDRLAEAREHTDRWYDWVDLAQRLELRFDDSILSVAFRTYRTVLFAMIALPPAQLSR